MHRRLVRFSALVKHSVCPGKNGHAWLKVGACRLPGLFSASTLSLVTELRSDCRVCMSLSYINQPLLSS